MPYSIAASHNRGTLMVSLSVLFNRMTWVLLLLPVALPTFAQQSDEPSVARIDEIVVTASKRGETNVQDLAMSIVALDQETLERMRVSDFTDFAQYVPGLDAVQIGPGQRRYLIRGINLPGESTIGLYYDGIPMSGNGDSAALLGANQPDWDLFDVQRVEVLRGPQGTLYGANSVAGVVRIITNKPDASAVRSKISVGAAQVADGDPNYNLKAMVNFPLIEDTLALRVVGYYDRQGGWIDNVRMKKGDACYGVQAPLPEIQLLDACNDGTSAYKDVNEVTRSGVRAAMSWDISDRTNFLAQFFWQDLESDARSSTNPIDAVNFGPPFVRPVRGGSNAFFTPAAGERANFVRSEEPYNEDMWIAAFELEHEFSWASGTLAASYWERDADFNIDSSNPARLHRSFAAAGFPPPINGALPVPSDHVNLHQLFGTELTSLEIRLASSFEGKVNFLGGIFYQDRTVDLDSIGLPADPNTGFPLTQAEALALMSAGELARLSSYPWETDPYNITHRIQQNDTEITALYGEVYIDINDQLELMGGLRWFETKRDQQSVIIVPFLNSIALQGAPPGPELVEPSKEDDTLYKVQLTYKPSESHQIYVQAAEGYRAGGVNARVVATIPANYLFDKTQNLELGAKTLWLDNRLQANIAIYRIDWDNVQFEGQFTQQFEALINCTDQSDAVEATGFEIDLLAQLTESFELGASYSRLDAEWQVDSVNCVSAALLADLFEDPPAVTGDRLVGVPDYSASLFGQLNWDTAFLGAESAFARLDIAFQGAVDVNDIDQGANIPSDSFMLLNLNVGLDWQRYSVNLYIRNLSDEKAWLSMFSGFQQENRVTPSRPRTIGLQFEARFGDH